MFYAAPEFWYILFWVLILLIITVGYLAFNSLKLNQKIYFLRRDRERYLETLYAAKDGYFIFIHPDRNINDPRSYIQEKCSRRLAVILNLQNGVSSSFDAVLENFNTDAAAKIKKYAECLKEEGLAFEDEFLTKNTNRSIKLFGARINGTDGDIFGDIIWFRDVSFETSFIKSLQKEKIIFGKKIFQLEDMIDNLPYPVWLRDEKANIIMVNKHFLDYAQAMNKEEAVSNGTEILSSSGESVSKGIAFLAINTNKAKSHTVNINKGGERLTFMVSETPFYAGEKLDAIHSVGSMVEISELDNLKRNLKIHQSSHLEILGNLDTAFAVFDNNFKLAFFNKAFGSLWKLDEEFLESQPAYSVILDALRSKRMLPEVPDFRLYKSTEQKDFSSIIEAKEDLLHLPDGHTFRRIRAPHPAGGLIFAFEDISDKLAVKRAYNEILIMRQEILNNLLDGVLIFEAGGRLKFFNKAYINMWNADSNFLQTEPNLIELLETQHEFFINIENWDSLKEDLLNHITNSENNTFHLNRNDGSCMNVFSSLLSDGSMMITYKKIDKN